MIERLNLILKWTIRLGILGILIEFSLIVYAIYVPREKCNCDTEVTQKPITKEVSKQCPEPQDVLCEYTPEYIPDTKCDLEFNEFVKNDYARCESDKKLYYTEWNGCETKAENLRINLNICKTNK